MEMARRIGGKSRSISKRFSTVLAFGLLVVGCGGNDIEAFEELQSNPMASPTLSFASPSSVSGQAAPTGGIGGLSRISTSFDIDDAQTEQAVAEFLAQAEAAGFELEQLELLSGEPGLVYVSVDGTSPSLSFGAGERTDGRVVASVTLTR